MRKRYMEPILTSLKYQQKTLKRLRTVWDCSRQFLPVSHKHGDISERLPLQSLKEGESVTPRRVEKGIGAHELESSWVCHNLAPMVFEECPPFGSHRRILHHNIT